MFSNFLIGLREGLEASLVVGIIVAYLVRTGKRAWLLPVWLGVGAAVAASLGVGALLTFTSHELSFKAQEGFAGIMSIVAVAMVTAMVFWMRAQSQYLKSELQAKVDLALGGGAMAVTLMAFLAVGREGLETALFLWPALRAAGSGVAPGAGAVLGLTTSILVGWLLYRHSVSLNLARFFRITGAALVVVAAGVLAYGIHDLQEAGVVAGLHAVAFDITRQVPPSSWYGTLLKGVFNFNGAPSWLELIAYFAYLVPVLTLFFRPMTHTASSPKPARAKEVAA
jgi:high-affinity iron transporter